MIMKWRIFRMRALSAVVLLATGSAATMAMNTDSRSDSMAETCGRSDSLTDSDGQRDSMTRHERKEARMRQVWSYLIPRNISVQYAGNIGMVSVGTGWTYGRRRRWETDMMIGYLPKFDSRYAKMTMTLKESFMPWTVALDRGDRWRLTPLTCGLFLNTVFGEDFWAHEPSRYPDSYYGFSTKLRASIYLGQQVTVRIPTKMSVYFRSVSLYYELSACDIYIVSAVTNRYLKLHDILSLGMGVRLNFFD